MLERAGFCAEDGLAVNLAAASIGLDVISTLFAFCGRCLKIVAAETACFREAGVTSLASAMARVGRTTPAGRSIPILELLPEES